MPLSKEKQAEYMREYRKRVIPKPGAVGQVTVIPTVIPEPSIVIHSMLGYAPNHFGTIKSKAYAEQWFA